ncbi:hypothetical protein L596_025443 [Steinernema carpocapsae]|uniref:Uncharacterized protein n=1 Tax=Steinernema carpocapsae TaxID=34508 RepID=A0A4U5M7T8_STECR|nr:hypothetical protein L596_025443 [Steinernema carpocapsae]
MSQSALSSCKRQPTNSPFANPIHLILRLAVFVFNTVQWLLDRACTFILWKPHLDPKTEAELSVNRNRKLETAQMQILRSRTGQSKREVDQLSSQIEMAVSVNRRLSVFAICGVKCHSGNELTTLY